MAARRRLGEEGGRHNQGLLMPKLLEGCRSSRYKRFPACPNDATPCARWLATMKCQAAPWCLSLHATEEVVEHAVQVPLPADGVARGAGCAAGRHAERHSSDSVAPAGCGCGVGGRTYLPTSLSPMGNRRTQGARAWRMLSSRRSSIRCCQEELSMVSVAALRLRVRCC